MKIIYICDVCGGFHTTKESAIDCHNAQGRQPWQNALEPRSLA